MGSRLGFFILRWFSRKSFRVLYFLSDCLYQLLNYLVRYRKRTIEENLKRAFPNRTQAFYKRIRKAFYRNFADFLVESLKVNESKPEEILPRVTIKNPNLLQSLYAKEKHLVLLSGHFFNWEWYTALATKTEFKTYAIYKRLSNAFLEEKFRSIRSCYHTTVVPVEQTYRQMVQAVEKEPSLFVFNADQAPPLYRIRCDLDFFGVRTPVFTGYDKMARKLGMAVVYSAMKKCGRGRYEIELELITENAAYEAPYFTVQAFHEKLEKSISAAPENYLWSHRRWKYQPGVDYELKP